MPSLSNGSVASAAGRPNAARMYSGDHFQTSAQNVQLRSAVLGFSWAAVKQNDGRSGSKGLSY